MTENPRPTHAELSLWTDLRAIAEHIRNAEFLLGLHPEKPREFDLEAVEYQLGDARAVCGRIMHELAEQVARHG